MPTLASDKSISVTSSMKELRKCVVIEKQYIGIPARNGSLMPSFIPKWDSSKSFEVREVESCVLPCNARLRVRFYQKLAIQIMDSPVVNHVFRQLFAPSRRCLYSRSFVPLRMTPREQQCRMYALRRSQNDGQGGSRWQQRIDAFPKDMSKQLREYPKLTASDLRHRTQRPRRVKMLARDFIEGWKVISSSRAHR